jgi:acetoin utilization deacetylase AcuC-like enzyme
MNVYEPHRATVNEMTNFHDEDYIRHLQHNVPQIYEKNAHQRSTETLQMKNINVGDKNNDCPAFPGVFDLH